ncbi:MAG TPA: Fur family transcriptional regulator [Acidimicrobiia bacterium]|nr:Fur family transcriptional regulator [Acidimicrobiia bacterium]
MTRSSVQRQVEGRLFDHDVRFTRGRRAVVETLSVAPGPLSAAELSDLVGAEVPLSSLYRTLSVLEEAGVVAHHLGAKGLTRYELAEWITGHHHHLVCTRCGSVSDVEIPASQEESVRGLVSEIAALASFTATDHALEIEGRCRRCG